MADDHAGLMSRQRTMTGAELKETVCGRLRGRVCALQPRFSASGQRHCCGGNNGSYTLTGITRNGQPLGDNDTVTVTCLATEKQMEALLASDSGTSAGEDTWVKTHGAIISPAAQRKAGKLHDTEVSGMADESTNQTQLLFPAQVAACRRCHPSLVFLAAGFSFRYIVLCRRPSIRKAPRIWKGAV